MSPEKVDAAIAERRQHPRFAIKLCWKQLINGRHSLHEQPQSARSWGDRYMAGLLKDRRVGTTVSDQLEYGLVTPGPDGSPLAAKKPTRWTSSSPRMLARLGKRRPTTHGHHHLVGRRTKDAANSPVPLLVGILKRHAGRSRPPTPTC